MTKFKEKNVVTSSKRSLWDFVATWWNAMRFTHWVLFYIKVYVELLNKAINSLMNLSNLTLDDVHNNVLPMRLYREYRLFVLIRGLNYSKYQRHFVRFNQGVKSLDV